MPMDFQLAPDIRLVHILLIYFEEKTEGRTVSFQYPTSLNGHKFYERKWCLIWPIRTTSSSCFTLWHQGKTEVIIQLKLQAKKVSEIFRSIVRSNLFLWPEEEVISNTSVVWSNKSVNAKRSKS